MLRHHRLHQRVILEILPNDPEIHIRSNIPEHLFSFLDGPDADAVRVIEASGPANVTLSALTDFTNLLHYAYRALHMDLFLRSGVMCMAPIITVYGNGGVMYRAGGSY
jgi:hypothetical protein